MTQVIPLPTDRAKERRPIHIEFEPGAFPGQRFALRLDWNATLSKWIVEFEHLGREFLITRSTATPYRTYPYLPFLFFLFADPSREVQEITPSTLGDEVQLYVLPGPAGKELDRDE